MAERVIAVEIGERITRVCETDYKGKGEIYHYFAFDTPEDVLANQSVNKSEEFRRLLTEQLEQNNIKTKKVVFAFNTMRIGSKEESIPVMKENKLKDYIKTNTARFFPVNPEDYQVVYRINGPEKEDMQRVRMYAIATEMVQAYEELAKFCGLTLLDLEVIENGIAQALRKAYPQGNVVNISVEEQNSSITILSDGNIELQRNISYGIEGAVDALMQEHEEIESYVAAWEMMSKEHFVHTKLDYESGQDKVKDEATEELRYVISNISRILEYYISKHQGITFDTVLLTGGGSGCKGLSELIAAETGYEVSSVDDTLIPGVSKQENALIGNALFTTVTAARNPIGISLRPAKKAMMAQGLEDLSTAKKFFVGCLAVCVLLVVIPAARMGYLTFKSNAVQQKIQAMAQAKVVYDQYMKTKAMHEELLQMIQLTETPNDALLGLLAEMEQGLPTEAVIQEMTADAEAVTVSLKAPNKKVAARTMEAFRSFSNVRDVSIDGLHKIEGETGTSGEYAFVITCYYQGTAVEESTNQTTEDVQSQDTEGEAE